MVVVCTLIVLVSLIALSWRKYSDVIVRSRHDPNWRVRDLTPSSSPTMKASKKKD